MIAISKQAARLALGPVALLVVGLSAACGTDSPTDFKRTVEVHTDEDLPPERRAELEKRLPSLQEEVAARPRDAGAQFQLGAVLAALRRYDEALPAYDEAIRLEPFFFSGHFNRASALAELGRLEEALAGYDRALEIEPNEPNAHHYRGKVLWNLGRLDEARAAVARCLELNETDVEAWRSLGSLASQLEDREGALQAFGREIEQRGADPKVARAHVERSIVYREMGRLDEALGDVDSALSIAPDLLWAHSERAKILAQRSEDEAAREAHDRAMDHQEKLR